MNNIEPVSFAEFKVLFNYAKAKHEFAGEPIPELSNSSIPKIKSALKYPFQTSYGVELFKTMEEKAASLLYSFAKGHYLINGNKRMAIFVFEYFLEKNGYELDVSDKELNDLIYSVVNSPSDKKDDQIKRIAHFLSSENSIWDFKFGKFYTGF